MNIKFLKVSAILKESEEKKKMARIARNAALVGLGINAVQAAGQIVADQPVRQAFMQSFKRSPAKALAPYAVGLAFGAVADPAISYASQGIERMREKRLARKNLLNQQHKIKQKIKK